VHYTADKQPPIFRRDGDLLGRNLFITSYLNQTQYSGSDRRDTGPMS
jgi:hypothetical protein